MGRIFVVGVGPGSRDYLTPAAERAIRDADILVGGKSALSMFPSTGAKQRKMMDGNIQGVISFIEANRDKEVAVLASGDPGFYSILDAVLRNFPRDEIEVIPGISSVQLCFARIRESWSDARFRSLHGRDVAGLVEDLRSPGKLALLTDESNSPNKVAELLLRAGLGNRRTVVCENLARANEKIVDATLEEISRHEFSGNCVMVIFDA